MITQAELLYLQRIQGQIAAKQAKTELYGLHYNTNFMLLFMRNIILKALQMHLTGLFVVYSDDDIQCLKARLQILTINSSLSSSCCNN